MGSFAHRAGPAGPVDLAGHRATDCAMMPPMMKSLDPRLKDAIVAFVVATGIVIVLLIAVPKLAWWIIPIIWLIIAARIFQGLTRRRAVDDQTHGKDRGTGA